MVVTWPDPFCFVDLWLPGGYIVTVADTIWLRCAVPIRLTSHAEDKFLVLERHGFIISRHQVLEAVAQPDRVVPGRRGRWVAEKVISPHYVVRVVYVMHNENVEIITFYPTRRERYEG